MPTTDLILLEYDGPIGIITNNRPDKHNAANDEMDAGLWAILRELEENREVKAVVWEGRGKSWSSGRDVGQIGAERELSQQEFMEAGLREARRIFRIEAPIVCALKGWVIGGSFERSLMCDLRIAEESTRFMLPEVKHGVLTDSFGMARLFDMVGHGVTLDLILTGRTMSAEEALRHGIVSRVVPDGEVEKAAREMAHEIAAAPAYTVKMARRAMASLTMDALLRSNDEEITSQTLVMASDDYAEMKSARAEERAPVYRRR